MEGYSIHMLHYKSLARNKNNPNKLKDGSLRIKTSMSV